MLFLLAIVNVRLDAVKAENRPADDAVVVCLERVSHHAEAFG
jgi:hypothetical protein